MHSEKYHNRTVSWGYYGGVFDLIILIEGHALGNGKTLLMVIKLVHNRVKKRKKIATNITLNDLKYSHIGNYDELEKLKNCVIGIDEIDLYCPESERNKGHRMYDYAIRNSRKRNIQFYFTVQQTRTIQIRVRAMVQIIAFPIIEPYYPEPKRFKYKDEIYECYFPPNAVMTVEYYQYNDSIVMNSRYDALALTYKEKFTDLYKYFKLYDTFEEMKPFDEKVKEFNNGVIDE